jgi:hypothetical protein
MRVTTTDVGQMLCENGKRAALIRNTGLLRHEWSTSGSFLHFVELDDVIHRKEQGACSNRKTEM